MERHQVCQIFRIAWPITVAAYGGAWVLAPPLGNCTRGLSLLEKYEHFLVVHVTESQEIVIVIQHWHFCYTSKYVLFVSIVSSLVLFSKIYYELYN